MSAVRGSPLPRVSHHHASEQITRGEGLCNSQQGGLCERARNSRLEIYLIFVPFPQATKHASLACVVRQQMRPPKQHRVLVCAGVAGKGALERGWGAAYFTYKSFDHSHVSHPDRCTIDFYPCSHHRIMIYDRTITLMDNDQRFSFSPSTLHSEVRLVSAVSVIAGQTGALSGKNVLGCSSIMVFISW